MFHAFNFATSSPPDTLPLMGRGAVILDLVTRLHTLRTQPTSIRVKPSASLEGSISCWIYQLLVHIDNATPEEIIQVHQTRSLALTQTACCLRTIAATAALALANTNWAVLAVTLLNSTAYHGASRCSRVVATRKLGRRRCLDC